MGRVRKPVGSPSKRSRDRRSELSSSEPSTNARTSGPGSNYKVPRYVHVIDGFPMTVTGKVRKVEMREHAVSLLSLERTAATRNA